MNVTVKEPFHEKFYSNTVHPEFGLEERKCRVERNQFYNFSTVVVAMVS